MTVAEAVLAADRFAAVALALDRGEKGRASALLDDLRRHEGPGPRLFELEARLGFEDGRLEDARRLLERARALDPDSAGLRAAFARVLLASALPS